MTTTPPPCISRGSYPSPKGRKTPGKPTHAAQPAQPFLGDRRGSAGSSLTSKNPRISVLEFAKPGKWRTSTYVE